MLPPLQSWAGVKIISLSLVVLFYSAVLTIIHSAVLDCLIERFLILFNFSFDRLLLIFCHVQPAGNISNYWKHLHNISPLHLNTESGEFFLTPVVTEVVSLVQWTNLICYSIWHNLEMLGRRVDQHQLFTLHHLLTTNFTRHKLSSENQQSLERKHATNTLPAQHRNI